MKKIILTFSIFIISLVGYSQFTFNIGVGYDYFTGSSKYYKRTGGSVLKFDLGFGLTKKIKLVTGVHTNITEDINYWHLGYYIDIDQNKVVEPMKSSNAISANLQLPMSLFFELVENKVYMKTGVSLNYEKYYSWTDVSYYDPGRASYNSFEIKPRIWGFGYYIGVEYYPFSRFGSFIEYKATQNSEYYFNYIEIGLIVRVYSGK